MKTDLKEFNKTGEDLKELRRPHDALFRSLGRNFMPKRSRFDDDGKTLDRDGMNKHIINGRPRFDLRTLQSGMHSGVTSPARPWFRLQPRDKALRQHAPVKEHFAQAEIEMRQLLQSSGLYTVLHTMWGDLGLFGFDAAIIEDDPVTGGLFGQALVAGEAWISANARGLVDTTYREFEYTTHQVVSKFVYLNDPSNTPDWTKVSGAVKRMWDAGKHSSHVPVRHLIMPRYERDPRSRLGKNKPVMSAYWEASESSGLLGDFGYDENPINSSRWDVEGTATYGSSPAMDAIGDARELQRKERDKAEAIRRMNRPAMNAPLEMRNSPFSMMPEAVNFMADPTKGMVPAYQVQPRVDQLISDIESSENRISEGMYANLFLMIANLDRRQITAREIDERHEEKLLALGPVLERQHREKLAKIIRRVYAKVVDAGRIPPLPAEFDGLPVEVDYTSTLAQAQKAVATGGIERLYSFVGNLSGVDGSVMDKLDNDKAVDEYADMVGVNSGIMRAQSAVDGLRKQRQDQARQAQQVQQVQQGAEIASTGAQAAKLLSEADAPRTGGGASGLLRDLGLTR